ncbi:MAG: SPOR domain-containing protein [bacterium]
MERAGSKIASMVSAPKSVKGAGSVKVAAERAVKTKKPAETPPVTAPERDGQVGKDSDQGRVKQEGISRDAQDKGDVPPQVVMQNAPPVESKGAPKPPPEPSVGEKKGTPGSSDVARKDAPARMKEQRETQATQKKEIEEKPKEEVSRAMSREGLAEIPSPYYLQFCSCVIRENAEGLLKKMIGMGYAPVIKENPGKVKMYNVYSGTFTQKSEAVKVLNRLKGDGFDPVLIPSSEGRFTLRISSCIHKESAKGIVERLNRRGYRTVIREELTQTTMYSVVLENFESAKEAEAVRQDLMKKGFESPILKSNPRTS